MGEESTPAKVRLSAELEPMAPLTNGKRYINVHEGTDLPHYFIQAADDESTAFAIYELEPAAAITRWRHCEAALRELVACKELKDRIESADLCTYGVADAEAAQAMADEYARRKPRAWAAAREAMGSNVGVKLTAEADGASWFTRGAAKVRCMFPAWTKKPTTSVAKNSGAFGSSMKMTGGFATCSVMGRRPDGEWGPIWSSDDGGKTWRQVVRPNVELTGRPLGRAD